MKPADILEFVQSQDKTIQKQEDATKYFEAQKNALEGIKNTSWLKEIKSYWCREYDSAATNFTQVDPNDVWKVALFQAQMRNAKSFLSFLDNILG